MKQGAEYNCVVQGNRSFHDAAFRRGSLTHFDKVAPSNQATGLFPSCFMCDAREAGIEGKEDAQKPSGEQGSYKSYFLPLFTQGLHTTEAKAQQMLFLYQELQRNCTVNLP